jgi:hypothetical protein
MQTYGLYFKCPVTKQMRYPVNAYEILNHKVSNGVPFSLCRNHRVNIDLARNMWHISALLTVNCH